MTAIKPRWGIAGFIRSKKTGAIYYLSPATETDDPAVVEQWKQAVVVDGREVAPGIADRHIVRVCACGCGIVLDGDRLTDQDGGGKDPRAKCWDEVHKARAWKTQNGYGTPDSTADTSLPPAASDTPRQRRTNGRPKQTRPVQVATALHGQIKMAADAEGVTMRAWSERALAAALGGSS